LEAADRFMQSIGVRVPEERAAAAPTSPPSCVTPGAPNAAVADDRVRGLEQLIAPPAPRMREEAPPKSTVFPDKPAKLRQTDEEPSPSAVPQPPAIVETRRVIVVERQSPARRDSRASGAGAPYYGLGQM
jgi:hypothetical protein